ncbi:hypothetical protein QZJ86_11205 [Methylomonas montana]|uniref:hypothetical protein n=1 Tax=Methylomonas montana TaxID=3058963 RepID=UPI0026586D7C|nr:hypothetical protein [Methylomonas montana]WKJ88593.1 hypothetical protein QZJ86_11205 [Methylomonas montana]
MRAAVSANDFNRDLFSQSIGHACWNNIDTKNKFKTLWQQFALLSVIERQSVFERINNGQIIQRYFCDSSHPFPDIKPDALNQKLADLTKHLFTRTKDLAEVRDACDGETIQQHFNNFCEKNGYLCPVCGTELLAQLRSNTDDEDQWRGPYDHLLSKDKYPTFTIHPDNLIPICHTCNSKAKGAKQLLFKKTHGGVERRRSSFYPHTEHCRDLVRVELNGDALSLQLTVLWDVADLELSEKMTSWTEVYQVKQRVEGTQADFIVWIASDCQPESYDDFIQQLRRKAIPPSYQVIRSECFKFWRFKLYHWIAQQSDDFKQQLWAMINQRRSDEDSRLVYGI